MTPLLAWESYSKDRRDSRSYLLAYVMSIKLVTLFPLLGLKRTKGDALRILGVGLGSLMGTGLAMLVDLSGKNILRAWLQASGPGYDASGQLQISTSGLQAQGWVSAIFRLFHLNAGNTALVFSYVVLIALLAAVVWRKKSARLSQDQAWAGWLGLTATIQPLAGFHTFVMAIPLAALALNSAFDDPLKNQVRRKQQIVAIAGLLAVTCVTQKLGPMGHLLQTASIKSWGVLCLLMSFFFNNKLLK